LALVLACTARVKLVDASLLGKIRPQLLLENALPPVDDRERRGHGFGVVDAGDQVFAIQVGGGRSKPAVEIFDVAGDAVDEEHVAGVDAPTQMADVGGDRLDKLEKRGHAHAALLLGSMKSRW